MSLNEVCDQRSLSDYDSREVANQWETPLWFPRQTNGDTLISGLFDRSKVKEEFDLSNTADRQAPFSAELAVTGIKRDFLEQPAADIRSPPCLAPPSKRTHFDGSSSASLTNSSSDAHSPEDLRVGSNVFTNLAFQSAAGDDYLWPAEEASGLNELTTELSGDYDGWQVDEFGLTSNPANHLTACDGLQRTFSERLTDKLHRPHAQQQQQQQQIPLTFRPWSLGQCAPLLEVSGQQSRQAVVSFGVQADKGFQFSGREGVWISQKKNHFQIACIAGVSGVQWAVAVPAAAGGGGDPASLQSATTAAAPAAAAEAAVFSHQLVLGFQLSLSAVRAESPLDSPPVGLEQSESNRARRTLTPMPLRLPGGGRRVRAVFGRLHFSAATLNNQRRRGELHPDQRFFQLVVGLDAVTQAAVVPLGRLISGLVIVRASNPGQFEVPGAAGAAETPEAAAANSGDPGGGDRGVWLSDRPGVAHFVGRVGVNTRTPGEALTVHGNLQLHGSLLQPSDARIKRIQRELRPADQLANISRIRIYNYSLSPTVTDTGVIAQEVAGVLPDAVRKSSTQRVPGGEEPLLLVNKDRIYMENVGAVKQLGELTSSLDKRIGELERMRSKLCRLRDSLRGPQPPQQQQQHLGQDVGDDGCRAEPSTDASSSDGKAPPAPARPGSSSAPSACGEAAAGSIVAASVPANKEAAPRCCSSGLASRLNASLIIALLAVLCCCFCALAALLLAEKLALAGASSDTGGGGSSAVWTSSTTTSVPTTTATATVTFSRLATKGGGDGGGTVASTSPSATLSTLMPTATSTPNDGVIRPSVDSCPTCRPVRCCSPPSPARLLTGSNDVIVRRQRLRLKLQQRQQRRRQLRRRRSLRSSPAVWELRSARLMSSGLGDWNLEPGRTARCFAAGDDNRRHRIRFGDGDSCVASNITVSLRLGEAFPAEAELHLRLELSNATSAAAEYCGPAGVYGPCQGNGAGVARRRRGAMEHFQGACVPVARWGSDCNLGPAAGHLRHLATLRFALPGQTNPCQMDSRALGETFLEVRFLIERQPYGCE